MFAKNKKKNKIIIKQKMDLNLIKRCSVLEERCQLLEERMSNYEKQKDGYVTLQSKQGEFVLLNKRQRNAGQPKSEYYESLNNAVELLQSKNIKITNENVRKLGYGSVIVNNFLRERRADTSAQV